MSVEWTLFTIFEVVTILVGIIIAIMMIVVGMEGLFKTVSRRKG